MTSESQAAPGRAWATLAEAIEGIRCELSNALEAGRGKQLQFDVGPVELEFAVEMQRDFSGRGGVKVWVVEIGASGGMSRDSTHRIKVILNPMDVTANRAARIGDKMDDLPQPYLPK